MGSFTYFVSSKTVHVAQISQGHRQRPAVQPQLPGPSAPPPHTPVLIGAWPQHSPGGRAIRRGGGLGVPRALPADPVKKSLDLVPVRELLPSRGGGSHHRAPHNIPLTNPRRQLSPPPEVTCSKQGSSHYPSVSGHTGPAQSTPTTWPTRAHHPPCDPGGIERPEPAPLGPLRAGKGWPWAPPPLAVKLFLPLQRENQVTQGHEQGHTPSPRAQGACLWGWGRQDTEGDAVAPHLRPRSG